MILPRSSYPLQGIFYFLSNWSLIRKILGILFITLVVALLSIGLTFAFLLRLQANGLTDIGCPSWLSWIIAVILCLLESVVFTIIFYLVATPLWQDALFDQVLRLKGLSKVLDERERQVSNVTICFRGICAGITFAFFQIYALIFAEILLLIITAPLHFIPVIGTFVYCYLNGWVMTWGHQLHYHIEIKEWSLKESRKFAWKNRHDYLMFGTVAVALELIPIANFLFIWTNVVGAALWTADVIIDEQQRAARVTNRSDPSIASQSTYSPQSPPNSIPYQAIKIKK
ncbi:hypothetical protein G9A89_011734 [Geosiphon pyriformis]|nr:hypothetical protein G9A89_011734 [Geosiphon pyriformis]